MLLDELRIAKVPLRYGTDACCLVLADSTYANDILSLRHSDLGAYMNRAQVTEEEHERWLDSRLARTDILDFVVLIGGKFGGTVSLTEIEHGKRCEYGRLIMPNDGRRIYVLAVEFLAMSFGFEVLGMESLYCAVVRENESVWRLHIANGWKLDTSHDRDHMVNGQIMHLLGMSIEKAEWPDAFERMKKAAKRLLSPLALRSVRGVKGRMHDLLN